MADTTSVPDETRTIARGPAAATTAKETVTTELARGPRTRRHTAARLGLALLIGALVGVWVPGPEWVSLVISVAAILVAALLSIRFDRTLHATRAAWVALGGGILAVLAVAGAALGLFAATGGGSATAGALLASAALLVTVAASFSVGALGTRLRATWGLALGTGLATWAGVGLRNLVPLAIHTYTVQDVEGFALLGLIITVAGYVVIGIPVALLGGLLGGMLRTQLARWATRHTIQH